jgi:hypothetical protein
MTESSQPRSFSTVPFWILLVILAMTGAAFGAAADTSCDWRPGQPYKMHWPQLPDLSPAGMDVSLSKAQLADDFRCTASGTITNIHIWGSFTSDVLPKGGAGGEVFNASILSDVPASGRVPSQPGQVLWTRTFMPGEYTFEEVNDGPEDWYEPVADAYVAVNHRKAYQFNFCIAQGGFEQKEGTVYWLAISADANLNCEVGWKTTPPRLRWNDAAVYAAGAGVWLPMDYPANHLDAEQPVGLAFVIGGNDAAAAQRDFGDAPDSSNIAGGPKMTAYPGVGADFPTVYEAGLPPYGPMHQLPRDAFYLGKWVSLENRADMGFDQDGVNNIDPMTDTANRDGGDDGLQMPVVMPPCQKTSLAYVVTVTHAAVKQAYVNVWCDWNRDGDWNDTVQCPDGTAVPEWAVQNQLVDVSTVGTYLMTTPGFACWHPASTSGSFDPMWMRITISEVSWALTGALATGGAGPQDGYRYGETEDYLVRPVQQPPSPQYDWGDAPDAPKTPGYPTLAVHGGARHVAAGPWLGDAQDKPDAEADGQPDSTATGDNLSGNNDESGVNIPPMVIGETVAITVEIGGGGGVLEGWIDFNGDHAWTANEKVYDGYLPDGIHVFWVTTPLDAVDGQSFARFRISTQGGLDSTGLASDGEVEDYAVQIIKPPAGVKWCQLPDTTPRGIDIRIDNGDQIQRSAADDFKCTSSNYLTHVTFWGSWKGDVKGQLKTVRLRIHADDPVGAPGDDKTNVYSKPSVGVLWEKQFAAGQFTESTYHVTYAPGEYWWDPATGELVAGGDSKIWRIDIDIDPSQAFLQTGTLDNPVIYWLGIDVTTVEGQFGWKTRQWPDHFMDDAVWDPGLKSSKSWRELRFPRSHPYYDGERNSIDMAFCLRYTSGGPVATSQPGTATQCPVVETRCPATDTRCPAVDTQCPVSSTKCPTVSTQCPTLQTQCPATSTSCPVVDTQCPTSSTKCPAVSTRCPAVSTQCPTVQTSCPTVSTQCPAVSTQCPVVQTQCPATSTSCPAVSTQCPTVQTQCPATQTECQSVRTSCPTVSTQCPVVSTQCPTVQTQCPATTTECQSVQTSCPVVSTQCPSVSTRCPAVSTQCPAVQTQCPATQTECQSVKTSCPVTETQCPVSSTKCPVVSTQCPTVQTQCPRCATAASAPSGWVVLDACPTVNVACATVADYLTALTLKGN